MKRLAPMFTRIIIIMRHRATQLRGVLLPTIVFGLAACGDGVLGPTNDTVFVLRTVDEDSLPANVSDGGDLSWTVIADTIWFDSGSDWRRRSVHRRGPPTGETLIDIENDGVVIRRGGEIILDFECRDTGDCIVPDRLRPTGAQLEMERTFLHAGVRLRFAPI
jgi:hypothetical protein